MSSPLAGLGAVTSLFGPVAESPVADSTLSGAGSDFSGALKSALGQVTSLQADASQQVTTMMNGGSGDLGHVMISVEKADVAFQLMMQVRNKVVSAYQDIEKMQF